MLARRDPWVNMLRATAACAGAAFGGADAISVLPFTWALGRPDPFARRMARNTHLVLQEESGLGRVMDPAAGAASIEQLTGALAGKAWELFQDVERRGGMAKVLESGFWQGEIARIAEVRSRAVATGRFELTGVSAFPRLADDGVKVEPHPPAAAVVKGGTSVAAMPALRLAAPFEELRDAADAFAARTGAPPRVFLANLGELAAYSARSTWMGNFLAAGGIEAVASEPLLSSVDAGRAFADSGARIACICSSDAVYAELAEATAGALAAAGAGSVVLAGRPREQEAALRSAGVDTFAFAGCDAIAVLSRLHEVLGVRT
jgi:methylmalonyl-CoA mutase